MLRYDVGVDANNFYPVSVKQIIEFFEMSRNYEGAQNISANNPKKCGIMLIV